MAEVDTSSYKLPTQPSVLEQADKIGGIMQNAQLRPIQVEQQQTQLDKSKLDLVNQKWGIINKELSTMAGDENINTQDVFKRMQGLLNQGLIDQNQYGEFIKQIPTDQKLIPRFIQTTLERGQDNVTALNWHYGQLANSTNQQTVTPGVTSTKPGFAGDPTRGGFKPTSLPIQQQVPPIAQGVNPVTGQPAFVGPQSPQNAPGTVAQPTPVNTQPLPVGPVRSQAIKGQSANFGGNVLGATVEAPTPAQSVSDRFPNIPRGPATGMPPMFEEGRKQLAADQELATQKLTAVKPALAALDLMKDLRSGPGTETWNKAVAFGKANGIIPISANDPTAIYQEVNKYLNQYVQGGGTRSDADLAQRELSNPNVTQQISPALEKLTRNTIALDRIQAARANAFTDNSGTPRNDLDKYPQHRSNFPAKMDEQAFIVDKLAPEERQKLFKEMLSLKESDPKRKRFFDSLAVAKRTGVFQ